ncbi:helix-turn-helix domain-containing protein [Kitasatospora sp. CB02891]|uniref:GbsR/MarR family transcriptional regulator n=1 Tax=Kitasatospora sp. CB02891 TaxID=2020329 RepID=UPI000C273E2B|nr:helix-turn-helix domain-containing protein [Kitasatospora sp. CB02891]PJN29520.1 MarR family transcriptional regulator [Kitasatospora sp. CB02891]
MPGGRLTLQDRRQIATGLAEGLGYGEIARGLGRPTSTVTREIGRNGGPSGYRAERAQHATAQRSRRSRTAPAPRRTVPARVDLDRDPVAVSRDRDPAAVGEFADQLAELLVHVGMPRMAARVLGCLYVTDEGSLTSGDLVQRLQVSPAAVSKAIGYLEGQSLVHRERDDRQRRERYVIGADIWYRALLASAERNAMLAGITRHGAELLGPATPAGARMDDASALLERIGQDIVRSVRQWHEERGPVPS